MRNAQLLSEKKPVDILRISPLPFKITRNYARCRFLCPEGILRYFEWAKNGRSRISPFLFKITRNYARCRFLCPEGILRYFEWAKKREIADFSVILFTDETVVTANPVRHKIYCTVAKAIIVTRAVCHKLVGIIGCHRLLVVGKCFLHIGLFAKLLG